MKIPILAQHIFSYECPLDLEKIIHSVEGLPYIQNTNNEISENKYILEYPEFAEVKIWADECLQKVMTEMDYAFQIKITQSWVNKSSKGMWHHGHKHANSLIAGILYLTPSGSNTWLSCPDIWFRSNSLIPLYGHETSIKEVVHQYPTTPGNLIMFPANLMHSVNEHDLDEPRYTLSFNSFAYGTLGTNEILTELVL